MSKTLKQLLFLLLLAIIATSGVLIARAVNNRGNAPITYLSFDEGYGTVAYDSIGTNNGTLYNGVLWKNEDECVSGKCVYTDGSDDYIRGDTTNFSYVTGTIAFWLFPISLPDSYVFVTGPFNAQMIGIDSDESHNHTIHGHLRHSPGDLQTASYAAPVLNTWSHIVLTYDATTVRLYLNGVLITSNTGTNPLPSMYPYYYLGSFTAGGYGSKMKVDEFKAYAYVRSASQIKADYASAAVVQSSKFKVQSSSEGLVGYWKMDESSWAGNCSTYDVIDSSGNGNTGTACNGAAATSTAKFGMAGNFDGSNDYVSVADSELWNFGSNDFTINYWIKWNGTPSGIDSIIGQSSGGGTVTKWHIIWGINSAYAYTGTHMRLKFIDAGLTVRDVAFAWVPNGNQWYHLSFTRSGSDWKFYVDGVQTGGTQTLSATIPNVANILQIGSDGESWNFFPGQIDDVKVYKTARSASQIRRDYESGPGPIGEWKLDDNTGTTAKDTSGNGRDLSFTNSPSWIQGKYGTALDFDNDDYASNDWTDFLLVNQTMEFWMKTDVINTSYRDLVGTTLDSDSNRFHLASSNNDIVWYNYLYSGGSLYAGQIPTIGAWYHVAGTYDGTTVKLYINGTLKNSAASSVRSYTATGIWIGGTTEDFDGQLDDVRIYNYARTQKQILEDMNAGHPVVGSPVGSYAGYWKFDEGYGQTTYDESVNNNNATLGASAAVGSDDPTWSTAGKFGNALSFDGSNDYVNAGDSSSLEPSTNITVSAWVKVNGAGTWAGQDNLNDYILAKGRRISEPYMSYGFAWRPSDSIFSFNLGTATFESVISSTAYTAPTNWVHLVGTYDGSNVRFYVNGNLNGIISKTGSISYNLGDNPNDGLWIGQWGGVVRAFNGLIDEVKIYPFVLSPDDIKQEYNRGSSIKMGSVSTESNGATPSWSLSREYCVPGDTTSCDAPVAQWRMDELTGQILNDVAGANDGTLGATNTAGVDDPTWQLTGCPQGTCLSFDGTDDVLIGGNNSAVNLTSSFTLEAWVKANASQPTSYSSIFNKGVWRYYLGIDASRKVDVWVNNSERILASTGITSDVWHHVAWVHSTSPDEDKVYVDGSTGTYGSTGNLSNPADNSSEILYIGDYGGGTYAFKGQLDDVRVYNYARTQAQIAWDYNRGKPIAQWDMNEGQDTATTCNATTATVYDKIGSNDGTLTLGASPTIANARVEGKYGCGITFDGTDDYVEVPAASSLSSWTTQITVSAWVRLTDWGGANVIGAQRESCGTGNWQLYGDVNDYLLFNFWDTGSTNRECQSDDALTLNTWQYVTATYNGSAIKIYRNGIEVHSCSYNQNMRSVSLKTYIGDESCSNDFSGTIDDVRVYNYALTAKQIEILYNEGSGVRFGPNEGLP